MKLAAKIHIHPRGEGYSIILGNSTGWLSRIGFPTGLKLSQVDARGFSDFPEKLIPEISGARSSSASLPANVRTARDGAVRATPLNLRTGTLF
jgi:hypothetical protein